MAIRCCNGCVLPKRHDKCHAHCPDYNTEIIMNIVAQAPAEKEKKTAQSITAQKFDGVDRAYKRHGRYKNRAKRN